MARGKQTCRILKEIRRQIALTIAGLSAYMILMAGSISSHASATEDKSNVASSIDSVTTDNDNQREKLIFVDYEITPQFPGGDAKLMEWIAQHLVYPQQAKEAYKNRKVIVQCAVEKDGTVSDVKVVRGVCKELDREAVRVIKALPNFTPGKYNGKPTRFWMTIPVMFKLNN